MPLSNCEVNLILTWSADCVIIYIDVANQIPSFTITEINLYQLKIMQKLLVQLNSGFIRVISWNKYLSKPELIPQNPKFKSLS